MTVLSVMDASCMAGVTQQAIYEKIDSGEMKRMPEGIAISELIRVYPNLQPLANLKIREVKKTAAKSQPVFSRPVSEHNGTVELLVRELEWNKELLEKTNRLMEKQLADQRALIADQARRLDDKDRFWARQVEIAQSLLPAPAQEIPASVIHKRRKIFGIF